jgi:hypothetical protein
MTDTTADTDCLRISEYTLNCFNITYQEFQTRCRYARWKAAEKYRLKAITLLKKNFDCFMEVCKITDSLK